MLQYWSLGRFKHKIVTTKPYIKLHSIKSSQTMNKKNNIVYLLSLQMTLTCKIGTTKAAQRVLAITPCFIEKIMQRTLLF